MSTTYHEWQAMNVGDKGDDVKHLQRLLAGDNRVKFDAGPCEISGTFTEETGAAVERMKWHLGYPTRKITKQGGQGLRSFLVDRDSPAFAELPAEYKEKMEARRGKPFPGDAPYPLAEHGTINGRPNQGTHNHPAADDPKHNWESCNALDINIPFGTTVIAVADGTIGSQIGPLDAHGDPTLLGLRLHLISADNEWYYAHLSHLGVTAGQHVSKGDHLGKSGKANGVEHLHFAQKHGDPGALIGTPTSGYVDHHFPG